MFDNGTMKYRSRTDITCHILEAANGGTTKTRIMYSAFLSYAQLKEYLKVLADNDLIAYDEADQIFKTTAKGHKFVKIYSQMSQFVMPEEVNELPPR
jgi:predicted transcriptional regulator